MSLWVIRIFFLALCMLAGYAISQSRLEIIGGGLYGVVIGFGLGGLLIALDQMLKGFTLRAFSAATFGLLLGTLVAWLIDLNELFVFEADPETRWIIRLGLFLSFSYLGMVLAMRSNREDFSLIIPYVRFKSQSRAEHLIVLDTSVIIDGRVAELIDHKFIEGTVVIPRFVLKELQFVADSADPIRRARGRRGLEIVNRIQKNQSNEVRIHDADIPEEKETNAKLLRLSRNLDARLYTNDYNLGKVAELLGVACVNLTELATALKPVIVPGEMLNLRIVREGKDKGQGVAYLPDGTMVVVNQAQPLVGQQVQVQVSSLLQTGAGIIVFADIKPTAAAPAA